MMMMLHKAGVLLPTKQLYNVHTFHYFLFVYSHVFSYSFFFFLMFNFPRQKCLLLYGMVCRKKCQSFSLFHFIKETGFCCVNVFEKRGISLAATVCSFAWGVVMWARVGPSGFPHWVLLTHSLPALLAKLARLGGFGIKTGIFTIAFFFTILRQSKLEPTQRIEKTRSEATYAHVSEYYCYAYCT